jgi:hypothetical protein
MKLIVTNSWVNCGAFIVNDDAISIMFQIVNINS